MRPTYPFPVQRVPWSRSPDVYSRLDRETAPLASQLADGACPAVPRGPSEASGHGRLTHVRDAAVRRGASGRLSGFLGAGGLRLSPTHEVLARTYRVIVFEAPGFPPRPQTNAAATGPNSRTASAPRLLSSASPLQPHGHVEGEVGAGPRTLPVADLAQTDAARSISAGRFGKPARGSTTVSCCSTMAFSLRAANSWRN
jgi:hypothetical protein